MTDKLDLSDVFNNPIVLDVWDSKYRLKTPNGASNEHSIEDSLKRVVSGVFALDNDKTAKKHAEAAVLAREFIPAGRIQAGAGTDKAVTLINCFAGREQFVTREHGVISFAEAVGQAVTVWTHEGWRPATVRSFGTQTLQRVTFRPAHEFNGKPRATKSNLRVSIDVTPNHRWILADGQHTTALEVGHAVPASAIFRDPALENSAEYRAGFRHGLIFGDGAIASRHPRTGFDQWQLRLCGTRKQALVRWFEDVATPLETPVTQSTRARIYQFPSQGGDYKVDYYVNRDLKAVPGAQDSYEYKAGFIQGWFEADGHINTRDETFALFSQNHAALDWLRTHAVLAGYDPSGDRTHSNTETNYGVRSALMRVIALRDPASSYWIVENITSLEEPEEVFCAVVPEVGAFTLASGIYTGNCYVNQDVPDSMPGIMQSLTMTALTMQQGGGVGTDFTTVRPKGSIVRRTGSVSSGILPFMDMWHAMCGTIKSSGSRRGAMMGTLADWHPDVLDFIKAKRTPGRLTNFNVSVLISDTFMYAVKHDKMWHLGFGIPRADGRHVAVLDQHPYIADQEVARKMAGMREEDNFRFYVYEEMRARDLWDTIIRSTYEYAEPGVIFVDQINKRNNMYYAEYIHCTNPCFSGDTRILTDRGYERFDRTATLTAWVDPATAESGQIAVAGEMKPLNWIGETQALAETLILTFKNGQQITCTPNHRFWTKDEGWVEAADLMGHSVRRAISAPDTALKTNDLHPRTAEAIGWFLGDGYVTKEGESREDTHYCVFQARDDDAVLDEVGYVRNLLAHLEAQYGRKVIRAENLRNGCRSFFLTDHASKWFMSQHGLDITWRALTKSIPDIIWQASREAQRAFLRGLYSADGTPLKNAKNGQIWYSTVSDQLSQDLLILWSHHGVRASISTRSARTKLMPDSNRQLKKYAVNAEHRVYFGGKGCRYFCDEIGFIQKHKQEICTQPKFVNAGTRTDFPKPEYYLFEEVVTVEPGPTIPVYCCNQPETNTITVGGFVTSQCGEQPLPPHNVCDLGPVNLAQLVKNPFTPQAEFDFDRLKEVAAVGVRLLDNVLDVTLYPLEEQRKEALSKRRVGVGITGLGNALAMLRLRYGSPEAVLMTENIMQGLALACYRASVELAKERGPFPLFDADKYLKADFVQLLCKHDSELAADIRQYGIRNSHLLSIAPTGTISLYSGNLSGGLEPTFSFRPSTRKMLQADGSKKEYHLKDFAYNIYEKVHGQTPFEQLPEYMVGALDLSVDDHLVMQATCQKWCDSAISKTINCPAEMDYDDFKAVYQRAYELGCKGCTTYRPSGVRDSVLQEIKPEPKEEAKPVIVGTVNPLLLDRPDTTEGRTYKLKWPGTPHAFYVTINHTIDAQGKPVPFEVFINSKSVEHQEWVVALTRTLSAVFRRGGDVTFLVEELTQVFSSKGGFFIEQSYCPSLVALIGRTLEREFVRLGILAPKDAKFTLTDDTGSIEEYTGEPQKQSIGDLCPACEQYTLIRVEGCTKCTSCSHSSCG